MRVPDGLRFVAFVSMIMEPKARFTELLENGHKFVMVRLTSS